MTPVFSDYQALAHELTSQKRDSSICLGNFDGLHRGHQALLQRCLLEAKRQQLASILVTFEPHPQKVLAAKNGKTSPKLLFELAEKKKLCSQLGFDYLLFQTFDEEFSKIPADVFAQKILKESLRASTVIVGENFHFGFQAKGNRSVLKAHGMEIPSIDFVMEGSETISSTQVRAAVEAGEIEKAGCMLGYPYFLSGRVKTGDGRGRKLGFPTANLSTAKECLPSGGVYAGLAELSNGQRKKAAINFGLRPTFSENEWTLEVHLLDFQGDLYGQDIRVFFLEKLRPEMKFSGVEPLREQIQKDIQAVKDRIDSQHFEPFRCFRNFNKS